MIKLGLLSVPALRYGGSVREANWIPEAGNGDFPSPSSVPFQDPLPIPPVLTPSATPPTGAPTFTDATEYYQIEMKEGELSIFHVGPPTRIWGYNGLCPGPTIVAQRDRRTVVRFTNHLPGNNNAVIHHHGGHTPPSSDGFPNSHIKPGQYQDYVYPNDGLVAAPLWYHDHTMDLTGRNVYMGLAGVYLLQDEFEKSLPLPKGEFDVPLLIQDRRFNADNSLSYNPFQFDGVLGDRFLVNGAIQPFFQVANRKYRFRFYNGSNARLYEFFLSRDPSRADLSPGQFVQIGSDQGLLPRPVTRSSFRIAMAERIDVVIDFSAYQPGTEVFLLNCLQQTEGTGPDGVNPHACTPIMRFDVVNGPLDDSSIPDPLILQNPNFHVIHPQEAVITRQFVFDGSPWVINDALFDPDQVSHDLNGRPVTPKLNTVEIWRLINDGGGWVHPIHIHDEPFMILDRNGRKPSPWEAGLKDTVLLGPDDQVRVMIKFRGENNVGRYVFHCHNMEHEDMRMMAAFEVVR
ncbi:MAG TPA: multicopper oxidase family protein [Terriglobales bacterium]|nr:multicopper oxidase family protein [Terriglobales bacterium]